MALASVSSALARAISLGPVIFTRCRRAWSALSSALGLAQLGLQVLVLDQGHHLARLDRLADADQKLFHPAADPGPHLDRGPHLGLDRAGGHHHAPYAAALYLKLFAFDLQALFAAGPPSATAPRPRPGATTTATDHLSHFGFAQDLLPVKRQAENGWILYQAGWLRYLAGVAVAWACAGWALGGHVHDKVAR